MAQSVKSLPANAGDPGLIPDPRRSPGEGSGNPLQCSCLGNPMDRGAWWATVHGVARVEHNLVTKPPPPPPPPTLSLYLCVCFYSFILLFVCILYV